MGNNAVSALSATSGKVNESARGYAARFAFIALIMAFMILPSVSHALPSLSITPSSPTIDVGQSITMTANPTGGQSPYIVNWFSNSNCQSPKFATGTTTTTTTVTPSSTTTYSANVVDSVGGSACSSPAVTVSVDTPTASAVTPSTVKMDVGQSQVLSSTPSGGVGTYAFQWYENAGSVGSSGTTTDGTAATHSFTPLSATTTPESFNALFTAAANSAIYASASSNSFYPPTNSLVTVYAKPTATLTPSNTLLDLGQYETYNVILNTGGAGPFAVALYNTGSDTQVGSTVYIQSPGGSNTITFQPTGTGSQTYNAVITDTGTTTSYSFSTASTSTITVNKTLGTPIIQTINSPLDIGQYAELYCNPSPLSSSPLFDSSSCGYGAIGGMGPYTYQWEIGFDANVPSAGEGTLLCGSTSTTNQCKFETADIPTLQPGTYNAILVVTDSATAHETSSSNMLSIIVNPILQAPTLTPSQPETTVEGSQITYSANVVGGTAENSLYTGTTPTGYQFFWYINNQPITCGGIGDWLGCLSNSAYRNYSTGVSANYSMLVHSPDTITVYAVDGSNGQPSNCIRSIFSYYCIGEKNSSSAQLTVEPALTASPIFPNDQNPLYMDLGQKINLYENPTNGLTPYSYRWSLGSNLLGANSNSLLFNANTTTLGTSNIILCINSFTGAVGCTNAYKDIRVLPQLGTPSILPTTSSATSVTMDVGQHVTLNASETGGTGNYLYAWYDGSTPITACNLANSANTKCTFTPTSSQASASGASNLVTVKATDIGTDLNATPTFSETSSNFPITVYPALATPAITPAPVSMDQGQSITLSASASGGTGASNYVYSWYDGSTQITGCNTSTCDFVTTGSTSTGVHDITVNVRDAGTTTPPAQPPENMTSSQDAITIYAKPTVTALPSSSVTMDVGQSIPVSATPTEGTGTYDYSWTSTGSCPGFSGSTAQSFTYDPTSSTVSCVFSITVTDAGVTTGTTPPATATIHTGAITVNAKPAASSLTPSNTLLDSGQYVTYNVAISGGSGPFNANLVASNGMVMESLTAQHVGLITFPSFIPAQGSDSYNVIATDMGTTSPFVFSSSLNTIKVNASLAVLVSSNTVSMHADQAALLTGTVTPGQPSYAYQWFVETPSSGSYSPITGANLNAFTFNAQTININTGGTYNFKLQTIDSASTPETANSILVSIAVNAMFANSKLKAFVSSNVINDEDSSSYGYWALDNFTRTLHIYQTGIDSYAVNVTDLGTSYIPKGGLNPGTGTIHEPYNGLVTMMGAQNVTLNGTFTPTLSAYTDNAFIGNVNFGGSISDILLGKFTNGQKGDTLNLTSSVFGEPSLDYYLNNYFTGITNSNQPQNWGYFYTYNVYPPQGQTWVDAANGITGDIVTYQTPAVTLSAPSNLTLDFGQHETYSATVSNGIGPFTLQLYELGASNTLITTNTLNSDGSLTFNSFIPAQGSDVYFVKAEDIGTTGGTPGPVDYYFYSASNTVKVNPKMVPSISPSSSSIHADQSLTLNGLINGGTPTYGSYKWFIETPGSVSYSIIPGDTSNTFTFNSLYVTTGGAYDVIFQTTDSAPTPVTANSMPASIAVNAMFANSKLKAFVSSNVINDEDSSSYGYWALDNFTRTLHIYQTGIDSYAVNVTDLGTSYIPKGGLNPGTGTIHEPYNGLVTMMGAQNVTLNGTFTPTLSAYTDNAFIGNVNFGGSISDILLGKFTNGQKGDTLNLTSSVFGEPSLDYYLNNYFTGITNSNQPQNWGYFYTYNVYPPQGQTWVDAANGITGDIVTYQTPAVTLSAPSNLTLDFGQHETYSATVSNGIGPFTLQLYELGASNTLITTNTLNSDGSLTFNSFIPAQGSDVYFVKAEDIGTTGGTPGPVDYYFYSASNTVKVNPKMVPSISPSSSSIHADQSLTLNGLINGGTPTYGSYKWFIETPGSVSYSIIPGDTSNTFTFNSLYVTTGGAYDVIFQTTDSAPTPVTANSMPASIAVNAMFANSKLKAFVSSNVINDEDSSSYGYWALDNFTRTLHIYQTGIDSYAVNVTDLGTSYIPKGGLNPGTGTIHEPYNGLVTMMGAQNVTLNGTFTPTSSAYTDNAFIGNVNFGGSISDILLGKFTNGQKGDTLNLTSSVFGEPSLDYYLNNYFTGITNSNQPQNWGYFYTYNVYPPQGQTWVDAANGITGDIVTYQTPAVTLSAPSNLTLDFGQHETYSATVSNGIGPFTLQLYELGASNTLITTNTLNSDGSLTFNSFIPAQGSDVYFVKAEDIGTTGGASGSANYLFYSGTNTVNVITAPTVVGLMPSNVVLDNGQSVTYTATIANGKGTFTANLVASNGMVMESLTAQHVGLITFPSFIPAQGSDSYNVIATDMGTTSPLVFASTSNTIMANADPSATAPTSSNVILDQGQSTTFSSTITSGTGPFGVTFNALGNKLCQSVQVPSSGGAATCRWYTDTSTVPATYSVTANGIDFGSTTNYIFASSPNSVIVNSALTVPTPTPSTQTLDQGQTGIITGTAPTTGTSGYTYQWEAALGGNALSANTANGLCLAAQSLTCSMATKASTVTGAYTFELLATDSASTPVTANSAPVTVNVNAALGTPTITPLSPAIDSGQPITFTANEMGGTSSYSYAWTVNGNAEGVNSNTLTMTPAMYGSLSGANVIVSVTDSATTHATVTSAADHVTINPAMTAVVLNMGSKYDSGQPLGLTAMPFVGGTLPYTYTFTVTNANALSPYSSACQVTSDTSEVPVSCLTAASPSVAGTYFANVMVTDSAYAPESVNSVATQFLANPTLGYNPISSSDSPLVTLNKTVVGGIGNTILINAALIGGAGSSPYTYYYTISNALSGAVANTLTEYSNSASNSVIYAPAANGIYLATVSVKDSATSAEQTSGRSLYFMAGSAQPVVSIFANFSAIDIGSSEPLVTEVLGGVGPFTVDFYNISSGTPKLIGNVIVTSPGGTNSIPFNAALLGTFTYNAVAIDTGNSGYTFNSLPTSITVNPPLGSVLTESNTVIDQGQSTILTADIHGGTPPYNFTFAAYNALSGNYLKFLAGNTVSEVQSANSMNSTLVNKTFETSISDAPGIYSTNVMVSDNGLGHETLTNSLIINPILEAPTLLVNNTAFTSGNSVTFNALASGGTAPYTYVFTVYNDVSNAVIFSSGPIASNSYSFTANNLMAGSDYANVMVTDSASTPMVLSSTNTAFTSNAATSIITPPTGGGSPGGGGGGGGGGSGGSVGGASAPAGGGTFKPTVLSIGNGCYQITNLTNPDYAVVNFSTGQSFNIRANFISPTNAGVTVDGITSYTLSLNQTTSMGLLSGYNYTIDMRAISYIPAVHTVTLNACAVSAAPKTPPSNATSGKTSTSPKVTVTVQNAAVQGGTSNLATGASSNGNSTVAIYANNVSEATGKGITAFNTAALAPGTYAIKACDTSVTPNACSAVTTMTIFAPAPTTTPTSTTNTTNTTKSKFSAGKTNITPSLIALMVGIAVAIAAAGAYYGLGRRTPVKRKK